MNIDLTGYYNQYENLIAAGLASPNAIAFTGTVELSPAESFDTARAVAECGLHDQLGRSAETLARSFQPIWMPDFVVESARDRWLERQVSRHELEILDRSDVVRDHGFGKSFQTHLLVERVEPSKHESGRMARYVRDAGRLFLAKCGGTLGLWVLLALVFWWVDRLSRGYMTGRLRLIAIGVGLLLPSVAFLFV